MPLILLAAAPFAAALEFRHVGDFLLQSHFKITGGSVTESPMKPMALHVFTDGVHIRISAEDEPESYSTYEIYRSDGIGRQREESGALEIIPGLQAMSRTDGVMRHLRLSAEALTITTFPGVSDQTIVSHAVAAVRSPPAIPQTVPAKP
ncbi:MAG: hypothetical protein EOP87_02395 [Verrucomicrobiaceae bacterium]|nr:MAG: hypothetical protein EOP87_02395 [Verrucomicrobiaceae bacterium]